MRHGSRRESLLGWVHAGAQLHVPVRRRLLLRIDAITLLILGQSTGDATRRIVAVQDRLVTALVGNRSVSTLLLQWMENTTTYLHTGETNAVAVVQRTGGKREKGGLRSSSR